MIRIVDVARMCHTANKLLCEAIGDYSQVDWDAAPDNIKKSAISGVIHQLKTGCDAEEQHQSWCDFKLNDGWVFGDVKDENLKTHPCLIPYERLPPEQKAKDHIFKAIVTSLKELIEEEQHI